MPDMDKRVALVKKEAHRSMFTDDPTSVALARATFDRLVMVAPVKSDIQKIVTLPMNWGGKVFDPDVMA